MPAEKLDSWLDIKTSCKKSRKKLTESINKINKKNDKTIQDVVDLSIERSMRRDVNDSVKKLERIVLLELNTLNEDDIKNTGLTERQLEIAILRQKMSVHKVAEELNCSISTVFEIYKSALVKIENYKRLSDKEKVLNTLSPQQKEVYKLSQENKSNAEIANKINTSIDNVKKQKRKIKQKLCLKRGGLKYPKK